ncbi:hypothetical protein ACJRO7_035052 [Eucalyptus globulus]|uniref:Uncharacterized protein n=1 Tax=Eucalyptus globulus TaxID=34317 RepID=A0ABD3JB29_EUCGL
MISTKKLIQMTRKWQKMAAIERNRILSSVTQRGHFVVYTTDRRRFVIALSFLSNNVLRELFRGCMITKISVPEIIFLFQTLSEEEFGTPWDGPIMLPIDALSMEYVISLIRRGLAKDQENALLLSFTRQSCSSSLAFNQALDNPEILVCS